MNMIILTILLALLPHTRSLVPQATSVSIGHSIRYELLLAANNDKSSTAFIPRSKADLEEVLLNDASGKLRDGDNVDESTVKYAKAIHVLPFHYTVSGYAGNLIDDYVTPYFMNSYRVVSLGDTFSTRGGEWAPQFKVVSIEGYKQQEGGSYIVGPNTRIIRTRGVVEETTNQNRESQFQDGSARPFHVNTVSDIPSDIRADKTFNRLFTDNLENKNMKIATILMETGESIQAELMKTENVDFKKFLRWKYRSCLTVKDLLVATGGSNDLKFLSEKGANAPASIVIDSFFQNDSSPIIEIMMEKGVSGVVCYNLFKSFAEEAKVHAKTLTLNSMEVRLGKWTKQQGPAAKKLLLQKYKDYATVKDLLQSLQHAPEELRLLSGSACQIPTSSIIDNFTQIHKVSFLDKMEENGISHSCAVAILFAFHRDVSNIPSGRRWPFRALIKTIITGVVSLFNRPGSHPKI